MTPARFRWGMILIQIGILILLRNAGIINDNFWEELIIFFPLVLIAVGIEKIFTKSKLQFIAYLTTLSLFFGGFALAFVSSLDQFEGNFFSESSYTQDADSSITRISAFLDVDNAELTIRDSGDDLIYAHFDQFTKKPRIKLEKIDGTANIKMTSRPNNYLGGAIKIQTDEAQDWRVKFMENIPLDLECTGDDADLHLNFSTTLLDNLNLDADNSTIYLKLGDLSPLVKITVNGDDSRLRLRVPQELGIKIMGDDYSNYLNKLGMVEFDSVSFVNEGYDDFENKVDITLDNRLSSFSIDYF